MLQSAFAPLEHESALRFLFSILVGDLVKPKNILYRSICIREMIVS